MDVRIAANILVVADTIYGELLVLMVYWCWLGFEGRKENPLP